MDKLASKELRNRGWPGLMWTIWGRLDFIWTVCGQASKELRNKQTSKQRVEGPPFPVWSEPSKVHWIWSGLWIWSGQASKELRNKQASKELRNKQRRKKRDLRNSANEEVVVQVQALNTSKESWNVSLQQVEAEVHLLDGDKLLIRVEGQCHGEGTWELVPVEQQVRKPCNPKQRAWDGTTELVEAQVQVVELTQATHSPNPSTQLVLGQW